MGCGGLSRRPSAVRFLVEVVPALQRSVPSVADGQELAIMVHRGPPIQGLIAHRHGVGRPGGAARSVMARADGQRPSAFLQHGAAEIVVARIVRRLVIAAVAVFRGVVAGTGLSQRFPAQRAAPRVGPAGGPVHGGQSHAPRGPAAPHVRVSGHLMSCHLRPLKMSAALALYGPTVPCADQ